MYPSAGWPTSKQGSHGRRTELPAQLTVYYQDDWPTSSNSPWGSVAQTPQIPYWGRMTRRPFVLAVGLLISVIAVIWVIGEAELTKTLEALTGITPVPVLLAAAVAACAMTMRSIRWAYLADAAPRDLPQYWTSVILGLLGNVVFPLRSGEAIRIALLAKLTSQPYMHTTVSSAVDRLNDVLALAVMVLVVGGLGASKVLSLATVGGAAALLFFGTAVILLVLRFGSSTTVAIERSLIRWRLPWRGLILTGMHRINTHMRYACAPRRSVVVVVINVAIIGLDCVFYSLMFAAMGWSLPWNAALTVWVIVAIGISLPSAPAYIGVYQAACIIVLAQYDIDATPALAFALTSQAVDIAVMAVQGVVAALLMIRASTDKQAV